MASKKKEELLQPDVQTQAQPAAQSTYSTCLLYTSPSPRDCS